MNTRKFTSINTGDNANLDIDKFEGRVIVQEKVDGSQFSVQNIDGVLHFSNKGKIIPGKSQIYINTFVSLANKLSYFKEGYIYHGEAMRSLRPNTIVYDRVPRYYWILYEVIRISDNYMLTPEEVKEMIVGTNIEFLEPLYDNKYDEIPKNTYKDIVDDIMLNISTNKLQSLLGGVPEGVVFKAINRVDDGTYRHRKNKFVRKEFAELNHTRKSKIADVSDDEFIESIGLIYNVEPRFQKAKQHLEENNKWKSNNNANVGSMVGELDIDLLKEAEEDIKNMLFCRFWESIKKNARKDLLNYMSNLESKE